MNVVGNREEGRGQNCRQIVLKNCQMGEGGVKNMQKLPTLFIDGPYMSHKTKTKVPIFYASTSMTSMITAPKL